MLSLCEHCNCNHPEECWKPPAVVAIIVVVPTLARGRGYGKDDVDRGFGSRGATQVRNGGPTGVYTVREPQTRKVTNVIADLLELSFWGFDVILGMDWLTEHRAKVNYEAKLVILCCVNGFEIVVVGESKELRFDEIRAVCDFSDVFPEELSGILPNREVEFGIKLYLGIDSVSIVLPYDTLGVEAPIVGVVGPRFHLTECVTVGSYSFVCEEERWDFEAIY
ncbi:uncharacterized protein [Gossypium hirsutum]|uniref:Uncharacterized protein n=1 Tax=Gossypium hirsutum TaxID=3635 RepID=A0A1U8ITE1_GOSHI|nr:uncharacterized protein LOC107900184 [Gossypium hirsutum]